MPKSASPPLSERMASVRASATALNSATDVLNQALVSVERAFREHGVGVVASVQVFASDDDQFAPCVTHLGWGKHKGEWRLLELFGPDGSPDGWTETPLLSADRFTRVRCVEFLPALVDAILAELKEEHARVAAATTNAQDVARQLAAGGADDDTPF